MWLAFVHAYYIHDAGMKISVDLSAGVSKLSVCQELLFYFTDDIIHLPFHALYGPTFFLSLRSMQGNA